MNKFFFFEYSYVLGIPIDYRAPALYLSDLFITLTILATFWECRAEIKSIINKNLSFILVCLLLALDLLLGMVFFSTDKNASIFPTVKIIQMLLFMASAILNFQKKLKALKKVLAITIAWQALVGIIQFLTQSSIGLYFLGERSFDISTVQIAKVTIFGEQYLRSYGTFPHPNVLGAFILTAAVIANLKPKIDFKSKKISNLFHGDNPVIVLSILGILSTFSKTAIILGCLYIFLKIKDKRKKIIFSIFTATALLIYFKLFTQTYIETIAERIILADAAINIAKEQIIKGVGPGNFISHLAQLNLMSLSQVRLLQPVHNVFLLILAENGLIGLVLITLLILKTIYRAVGRSAIFLVISTLTYLSVDHFFWTLHQGQLIFFLSLAFIYSSKISQSAIKK